MIHVTTGMKRSQMMAKVASFGPAGGGLGLWLLDAPSPNFDWLC